ncbi:SulP family inorganic anion transporter [Acaryochloris thomasi]|uniref:SulP family inorganic anion transporter n=1 Tax=Acaryochloris thomasi TaxID=2929456 RepID=UPI000DA68474|nr:SulP family inorganic anion transporter [Acaryochloris thomasi]
MSTVTWQREWFSNTKADILAGTVVALALIPEAIAFSIIAGVDPKVGLYASFCIAVVSAFVGGRPGLISAATGAMALLMVDLVKEHGLEYLLATTILTGVLQIIFGLLKLGRQMKYIPRAVMIGFVNALAILIFMAQIPELTNVPLIAYGMVAIALAIIYLLPRLTTILPSPLVAIVSLTAVSIAMGLDVPIVGDKGELPTTLPLFALPQIPLTFETLQILFSYALPLAVVGLLESLLTASLLDELTDTPSDKNREAKGQGIANIVAGFFGGMAGCAMIGQSVINIQSGGRQRLSTFWAGVFLLFLIVVLGPWVQQIPMASLVAVMIMVSIGTFNWGSIKNIKRVPRSETVVMVTTVVITIWTHNLAIGVVTGVALSTIFFSRKIAQLVFVDPVLTADGEHRIYNVAGQIFFVSVDEFFAAFNFEEDLASVKIDLTHAHLWDQSAVAAVDKVVLKFRRNGIDVNLVGLNEASQTLLKDLAEHDKPGAMDKLASH